MPEAHVVSVAGPIPVAALGVVDAHDHLFLDSPAMPGQAFADVDKAIEEGHEGRASGIGTLVEMTPIGLGRRPAGMRAVAEATGLTVIAASGYHRDAHYPEGHWVHGATVEALADRIVTDLTRGMHPSDWTDPSLPLDPARAGAIKGGASYHRITRSERRRLEAIGGAAAATGAAVLVHTEIGTSGHEIVDLLESTGLTTDRIALAHLDRNPDAELHADIAARGVTLEYDTIGRTKYHPDSLVLQLIEDVVEAGHQDRIVLGLDLGARDYLRAYEGGPGMRYLMATFVPRLRGRLGGAVTDRLLVDNPARLYAIAGGRVSDRYDVVVVGSGSAGSSAAITSARHGARTLLLDRLAFMGGTSTAVLDTFYAFYTPGTNPRRVVGGLGWEVASRLTADGVAFERPNTYGAGTGVTYDAEALKVLWERLAEDAGVELLLHTWATGVRLDADRRIEAVRLWNKGGERWVEATAFVDASGDADICALAGAGYDDANTTPGGVQSLSTLFKLANVDVDRAGAVPKAELWDRMREAVEHGGYRLPRVEGSWHRTPYAGVVLIHMTRIPNVDATDPAQLTRAEVEGRRQVQEYHRFLRDRVPGFERSVVVATSPAIGVRESRRVHGDHRLTREEVLGGRRFVDEIALCGAPIEDHGAGGDTAWQYVGESGVYGIPYRCLLPAGIEGLLMAGRCFSATHDAHASARSMATCMAMGQAAGTAAAMAAAGGTTPRGLAAVAVRERLLADGALLEPVAAEVPVA